MADRFNQRIQKFDSAGKFIRKWGGQGSGDGQFWNPYDVAVDSSGYALANPTYENGGGLLFHGSHHAATLRPRA